MREDEGNDRLTLGANAVAGRIWAALMIISGVALFWISVRNRAQLSLALLIAVVSLVLVAVGVNMFLSRTEAYCFDRAARRLAVRGGTLVAPTEKSYPLSDIEAVVLSVDRPFYRVELLMSPRPGQGGHGRRLDVLWGEGREAYWQAKAGYLASFLAVRLLVEDKKEKPVPLDSEGSR